MRLQLLKMLEKLGVDRMLAPYETQPWYHYDAEKAMTCSAEVRMGPGAQDLEAEVQLLADETPDQTAARPEQIMRLRVIPALDKTWSPVELWVKGEDFVNKFHGWEEKACNFFRACIQSLQMGEIPDMDALIEKELDDDDGFGGKGRGKIGRKAPKIKPAQLLGVKKPM
ncbi:MAG: hypothetical protein L6Q57_02885 [Alphaproteobacteria bacterium]|nr:hypothetical protein [Alphaproteobacteria bacterium]